MAVGARSLRGAMSTYTWVATAVTAGLALVLWLGPCHAPSPAAVTLSAEGPWLEATLDDGSQLWELLPGEPLLLTPGDYRVTLFGADGHARRQDMTVGRINLTLGGDVPLSPSGSESLA
ncbi:MAG: hypothetical protein ACI9EF_003866, partial [Pseudohongiellaceae bacterium]